jgi:hypothetical protein
MTDETDFSDFPDFFVWRFSDEPVDLDLDL